MSYSQIVPYAPRIAAHRDLPDTSTPVLATDIDGWQNELTRLGEKVNEVGKAADASAASVGVLGAVAPKGTLLVSDGSKYVALPPGGANDALIPDANAELGVRWGKWNTPKQTITVQAVGYGNNPTSGPVTYFIRAGLCFLYCPGDSYKGYTLPPQLAAPAGITVVGMTGSYTSAGTGALTNSNATATLSGVTVSFPGNGTYGANQNVQFIYPLS